MTHHSGLKRSMKCTDLHLMTAAKEALAAVDEHMLASFVNMSTRASKRPRLGKATEALEEALANNEFFGEFWSEHLLLVSPTA